MLKQDHLFPSGSYKDRGAAVLVSKVKELGIPRVVEDSSGNAGCAVAAYCAQAGIGCTIMVPEATSPAKLTQIRLHGAELIRVPGSRQETAEAALRLAQNSYYASHSWNPFFFQGTKTFAYEISEQLGWRAPDAVVLPVGNGTLLLGAAIGFGDLLRSGVIAKMPRLVAVQAAACAPLAQAFAGEDVVSLRVDANQRTLAEGIAIATPVRGPQILAAVRNSRGCFLTVSEDDIVAALLDLAGQGFYVEPTSAATIAGLRQYLGMSDDSLVVSVLTGHGLKSTEKLVQMLDKGTKP